MSEEKKTQEEATAEGAVEVKEEDLDQASGGAGYIKSPVEQEVTIDPTNPNLRDPTILPKDPSLNYSPTKSGDASIIGEEG